ncbi:MAG: hypothetical protein KAR31_04045, partial [Candidatus Omnitrophica bacterium]|nr:hypothetical protein [Candidatus Omnitrophota bacterium]
LGDEPEGLLDIYVNTREEGGEHAKVDKAIEALLGLEPELGDEPEGLWDIYMKTRKESGKRAKVDKAIEALFDLESKGEDGQQKTVGFSAALGLEVTASGEVLDTIALTSIEKKTGVLNAAKGQKALDEALKRDPFLSRDAQRAIYNNGAQDWESVTLGVGLGRAKGREVYQSFIQLNNVQEGNSVLEGEALLQTSVGDGKGSALEGEVVGLRVTGNVFANDEEKVALNKKGVNALMNEYKERGKSAEGLWDIYKNGESAKGDKVIEASLGLESRLGDGFKGVMDEYEKSLGESAELDGEVEGLAGIYEKAYSKLSFMSEYKENEKYAEVNEFVEASLGSESKLGDELKALANIYEEGRGGKGYATLSLNQLDKEGEEGQAYLQMMGADQGGQASMLFAAQDDGKIKIISQKEERSDDGSGIARQMFIGDGVKSKTGIYNVDGNSMKSFVIRKGEVDPAALKRSLLGSVKEEALSGASPARSDSSMVDIKVAGDKTGLITDFKYNVYAVYDEDGGPDGNEVLKLAQARGGAGGEKADGEKAEDIPGMGTRAYGEALIESDPNIRSLGMHDSSNWIQIKDGNVVIGKGSKISFSEVSEGGGYDPRAAAYKEVDQDGNETGKLITAGSFFLNGSYYIDNEGRTIFTDGTMARSLTGHNVPVAQLGIDGSYNFGLELEGGRVLTMVDGQWKGMQGQITGQLSGKVEIVGLKGSAGLTLDEDDETAVGEMSGDEILRNGENIGIGEKRSFVLSDAAIGATGVVSISGKDQTTIVSLARAPETEEDKQKELAALARGEGSSLKDLDAKENLWKTTIENIGSVVGKTKTLTPYQEHTGTLQYVLGGQGFSSTMGMAGAQLTEDEEGSLIRVGNAVYLTDGGNNSMTIVKDKKSGALGLDEAYVRAMSVYTGESRFSETINQKTAFTIRAEDLGEGERGFLVKGDTINGQTLRSLRTNSEASDYVGIDNKGEGKDPLEPLLVKEGDSLDEVGLGPGTAKAIGMGRGNYFESFIRNEKGEKELTSKATFDKPLLIGGKLAFRSNEDDLLVPNDFMVIKNKMTGKVESPSNAGEQQGDPSVTGEQQGSSQTKAGFAKEDLDILRLSAKGKGFQLEFAASPSGVTPLLHTPGSEHTFAARIGDNMGLDADHTIATGTEMGEFDKEGKLVMGGVDKEGKPIMHYSQLRANTYLKKGKEGEEGKVTVKFTKQGIDYGSDRWTGATVRDQKVFAEIQGLYAGLRNEGMKAALKAAGLTADSKEGREFERSKKAQAKAKEYADQKIEETLNVKGDDAVRGVLTSIDKGLQKTFNKDGRFVFDWAEVDSSEGTLSTPGNVANITGMMKTDAGWAHTFGSGKITHPDIDASSRPKDTDDPKEKKQYNLDGEQAFPYRSEIVGERKRSLVDLTEEGATYNLVNTGVRIDDEGNLKMGLYSTAGFGGTKRTTRINVTDGKGNISDAIFAVTTTI